MEIARFIDSFWSDHWTSPTVREIAQEVGLSSPATVHVYLKQMVQAGILEEHKIGRRVLYRVSRP